MGGWRVVGAAALAVVILVAGILGGLGFDYETLRMLARATARGAMILFLAAFVASSLQALLGAPWTVWLLRNRRYLGLSFALWQGVHLLVLIALALSAPAAFLARLNGFALAGGALAYAFVLAMTITSFDGPRRWLGPQRWHRLHTLGGYYIWLAFAQSYLPRALKDPFYLPFALALVAALGLRLARAHKRRTRHRLGVSSPGNG